MAKKHGIRDAASEQATPPIDSIVTNGNVTQTAEPTAQLPLAVTIAVPLGDVARVRPLEKVWVVLTKEQSLMVQKVAAGLRANGDRLKDGRVFAVGGSGQERGSPANALSWILEQIAAQVDNS